MEERLVEFELGMSKDCCSNALLSELTLPLLQYASNEHQVSPLTLIQLSLDALCHLNDDWVDPS